MSVKAIIIGAFVGFVVVVVRYLMVRSSEITWSYFPTSVGFCFIALFLLNVFLKRLNSLVIRPRMGNHYMHGLSRHDSTLLGDLLAIISSSHYGATPENDWEGNITFLPEWLVPVRRAMAPFL